MFYENIKYFVLSIILRDFLGVNDILSGRSICGEHLFCQCENLCLLDMLQVLSLYHR